MFVFLNKKVITATFSTLFVTSRGYAETAPLSAEEKIRGLDSSCICSISDLIGSHFSCTYSMESDYYYDIPNFGEEGSVCTKTNDWNDHESTHPFVSADDTSVVYNLNGDDFSFTLDPSQVVEGFCEYFFVTKLVIFGCWACPAPTSFPSFVPTDSPSPSVQPSVSIIPTVDVGNNDNDNPTDDAENDDNVNPTDEDEECCCERLSLFISLQKLLLV